MRGGTAAKGRPSSVKPNPARTGRCDAWSYRLLRPAAVKILLTDGAGSETGTPGPSVLTLRRRPQNPPPKPGVCDRRRCPVPRTHLATFQPGIREATRRSAGVLCILSEIAEGLRVTCITCWRISSLCADTPDVPRTFCVGSDTGADQAFGERELTPYRGSV